MSTFLVVRGIFSSILKPSVDLYIRYEAALWKEELVHDTIIIMGESDTLVPSKMISSYLHDISLGQADAFADEAGAGTADGVIFFSPPPRLFKRRSKSLTRSSALALDGGAGFVSVVVDFSIATGLVAGCSIIMIQSIAILCNNLLP